MPSNRRTRGRTGSRPHPDPRTQSRSRSHLGSRFSARTRSRTLAAGASVLALTFSLASCGESDGSGAGSSSDPVVFGVSAPLSGDNAEYGKYWKQGFALALEEINGKGGIDGREVELKWEDSQSDPKQSVPVATKFVSDESILAELGDFASPASMAASPIYQRAKMVQYGFTNSHPDFTKGGDYMWSPCLTQEFLQQEMVRTVAKYAKRVAVVHQATDWGKSAYEEFAKHAKKAGVEISYSSAFLPTSTDFRPILIKARDSDPDAIVHLGYARDGALIAQQIRAVGFKKQFFGGQNTPEFLDLAGDAAEGGILAAEFVAGDPHPRVRSFVEKFRAKYKTEPNQFNVMSYDALIEVAYAAEKGGPTREGIKKGLESAKNLPSVFFKGQFAFGSDRRPKNVTTTEIIVKDGKFVPNTGSKKS